MNKRLLSGVLGAAGLLGAALPDVAFAEVPDDEVPDSLKSAIETYIESQGHEYAGLCRTVNQQPTTPFGKHCAFVLDIEHDIAEVSYGPVATNDLSLVSFKQQGGAWTVVGATPTATATATATQPPATATATQPASTAVARATPKAPATGQGKEDAQGLEMWIPAALALAGLGGAAAVALAAGRRK